MSARETAALLLQTARIMQAEGYDGEVSPAQWMAIRFFAGANRLPRTPSAFSELQSTTRGTATQNHQSACGRWLPARQKSETDGRSVSLQLTDKGRDTLARDPFEVLMRGVTAFDTQQRAALHALQQLLSAVAASGSHRRLPGLLLHRWRHLLQPDKHAFIGPRMPAARRSNAA